MDWVQGLRLDQFLEQRLGQPGAKRVLRELSRMWLRLSEMLREAEIGHGDLQHGNVMLVPVPGTDNLALKLIDYDGMYVPELADHPPGEIGHPAYQHPGRTSKTGYGPTVDRFSHLVIYTTLRALIAGGRELWDHFYNGDRLLLGPDDFRDPENSEAFRALWQIDDPDVQALTGYLGLAAAEPIERVPLLSDLVTDSGVMPLTGDQQGRASGMIGPRLLEAVVDPDLFAERLLESIPGKEKVAIKEGRRPATRILEPSQQQKSRSWISAIAQTGDRLLVRAIGEENTIVLAFVRLLAALPIWVIAVFAGVLIAGSLRLGNALWLVSRALASAALRTVAGLYARKTDMRNRLVSLFSRLGSLLPGRSIIPESPGKRRLFAAGAVLLIALGLVLGAVIFSGRETVPPVEIAEAPMTREPLEMSPEEDEDNPIDQGATEEEPTEEMPELPEVEEEPKEPEPEEPEEEQPPLGPFHDIRARQNRLRLPPLTVTEGAGTFANTRLNREVVELAEIDVKNNADLDLQLGGSEFQPRQEELKYDIRTVDKDTVRRWEVMMDRPTAIGSELIDIATFSLKNGALRFNWETEQPPFRLAFCTLKLTVDDKSETCHFEWEVAREPSIQPRTEAAARYHFPGISRFSLRPDDEVSLELRFSGMPGARFAENPTRLTLQQDQTGIRIPLKSYDARTMNPDVSVRLSLNREEDTEFIRGLWIESAPIGPAPTLEQTQELPREQWKREHWKTGELTINLSAEGIDRHFGVQSEHRKELRRLEDFWERESSFSVRRSWGKEPAELRRVLVGRFVNMENEIKQMNESLNLLDDFSESLERGKPSREERDNWQEIKEENRRQAKKLMDDLRARRSARDQLNAKYEGRLSEAYKRYQLADPAQLEFARMHLFFQDYQDELQSWHSGMNWFAKDLRNNGRLDYRLYVTVDGREIDLLITEGFLD
jgi:hypothetical protein